MLVIASEDNTRDLGIFPRDMHYSVFEGTVNGDGYDRHITFRAPQGLPLTGKCLPMFTQGDERRALWHEVNRTYAGPARTISAAMYERIWDDWFFAPSGERYEPKQVIRLPASGEPFPMQQVLGVYKMLRRLQHRDVKAYGHLAFVAHDKTKSIVPTGWVMLGFARRALSLAPNEEIDAHRRLLLAEMLHFDPAQQRIRLIMPWHNGA